jgi:hypothetical protein
MAHIRWRSHPPPRLITSTDTDGRITLEGECTMRAETWQMLLIFAVSAVAIYALTLPWLLAMLLR